MTYQHLNEMILGDFFALLVFMVDFWMLQWLNGKQMMLTSY